MSIRRLVLMFACIGAMSSTFAQTTTTTTGTRDFNLPPVGLGATETAEINVVNFAANASDGTAASCTGTISFLNESGATTGSAAPFTVTAGQISSAHLPFSGTGATGTRTAIRGLVTLTLSTGSPRPPCALGVSLGTFDTTTGATHALVTAGAGSGPVLGPGFGPGPGPR
jgi:hypothetical protein